HSPGAAEFLREYLLKYAESPENLLRFAHHIARYGSLDGIGSLTELAGRIAGLDDRVRAELLKTIHQGLQERGTAPGAALHQLAVERAQSLLRSRDPGKVGLGIDLAHHLQLKEIQGDLRELVEQPAVAPSERSSALAAVVAIDPAGSQGLVAQVLRDAAAPI